VLETVSGSRPGWSNATGPRPVGYIGSTVDRNSAGTFVTLAPEIGVDFGKYAIVAGLPIYRISATQRDTTGIGDAYLTGERGRFRLRTAKDSTTATDSLDQ